MTYVTTHLWRTPFASSLGLVDQEITHIYKFATAAIALSRVITVSVEVLYAKVSISLRGVDMNFTIRDNRYRV